MTGHAPRQHRVRIAGALLTLWISCLCPAHAQAFDLSGPLPDKTERASQHFWDELEKPEAIEPVGVPNTFADLAEAVSPAVVNIRVSGPKTGASNTPRRWQEFHDFPFELGPHGFGKPSWGEGSGFVISNTGYVVTNAHVVEGTGEIRVSFFDGRTLSAQIVGVDAKTDIALIKVESDTPLLAVPLGNSDIVRPGEWVVAIGNAMSLEHSVTAGIVSAKHRYLARGDYDDFIQTDAAINPGNSGGPLINLAGEVIGINTAINPQANTIGFAVPINIAKQILPQLKEHGQVTRSWLGVEIQELTEHRKQESGATQGALVKQVLPATPAMRAGIEKGDVIIVFDGNPVASHRQLPVIVASSPNDREVEVEVMRAGQHRSITVLLAERKDTQPEFRGRRPAVPEASSLDRFGFQVQDLERELAEQLDLENHDGVIVTQVSARSPAESAGLRRGDVILEIEGQAVNTTEALIDLLAKSGSGAVVLVRRDDATLFLPLREDQ